MKKAESRLWQKIMEKQPRVVQKERVVQEEEGGHKTGSQIIYEFIEDYAEAVTSRNLVAIDGLFDRNIAKLIKNKLQDLADEGLVMVISHENPHFEVISEKAKKLKIKYNYTDCSYFLNQEKMKVGENNRKVEVIIEFSKFGDRLVCERLSLGGGVNARSI